jgi:hypothetical protein
MNRHLQVYSVRSVGLLVLGSRPLTALLGCSCTVAVNLLLLLFMYWVHRKLGAATQFQFLACLFWGIFSQSSEQVLAVCTYILFKDSYVGYMPA